MPGAVPKPPANAEPTFTEEHNVDKTMNNILRVSSLPSSSINVKYICFFLKDKARAVRGGRAPRSRNHRVADATAASNMDDDSFFNTPTSTTTTPRPSSTPAAVPKVTTPTPSVVAPVTGLPDKPAAIAAKQTNLKEKKKLSLFDSDDSEIDDLLFGSSARSTLRST